MFGQCRLCLKNAWLQHGHIIPAFAINWLKTSSPKYMRGNQKPNLRLEDGYKRYFFCRDCEQLLSGWEKSFKEQIFTRLHENPQSALSISYGDWLLKFAVSISWRVLLFCSDLGFPQMKTEQGKSIAVAGGTWRKFLLGKIESPKQFEQHLLPMDVVDNNRLFNNSPYINRYLLSTIDLDLVIWESTIFVYAKLGRFLLFALVEDEYRHQWRRTKLNVKNGVIEQPGNYSVPENMLKYVGRKANDTALAASKLSTKQRGKIEQFVDTHPNEVAASEYVKGLRHDTAAQNERFLFFDFGSNKESDDP